MNNSRLIIVSNRLPYTLIEKKGGIVFSPSAGGLVSSIKSYIYKTNQGKHKTEAKHPLWIGTCDLSEKKFNKYFTGETLMYDDFEMSPVFLPSETKHSHYSGFCNDTIWPLFHYFPSYAKFKDEYYEHYSIANRMFCEKILQLYKPGDIIWIHDYHLMLLPALLRKYYHEISIGFFLHIPFPSFELFRLLPNKWRKEILNGLLGADLIGFQTNDYVQYFLKSVWQILGYENSLRTVMTQDKAVTADTFPISIDYEKFHSAANDAEVFAERNRIRKKLPEVKIIISVDRLDYTKGTINRLEGFELFLEEHPQYRGNVVYIMVVVPSRDAIPQYSENKKDIEGLVSKINGKFGSIDWTPVVYQYRPLDFKKLTALYLAADAALVTPLRDGMNLVAKEFIASQINRRGMLILSETAGSAEELGEAIIVNSIDRKEISDAILQALEMTVEEQMLRNEAMQNRIKHYDVLKWAEDFLSQLYESKIKQKAFRVKEVSEKTEDDIMKKYNEANRRMIFLDYDGTLIPFARLPHLAAPTDELKNLLLCIAHNKKNSVVLISGRKKESLEEWFGDIPVNLAAEHGAFCKKTGENWMPLLNTNPEWKSSVMPVMDIFTGRCAGTFVEEKFFSLAWHYRNAEKGLAFLRSRELINTLLELSSHLDFQIIEGNKVIEVRTRGIDKGMVASSWLANRKYDFILAIGDDRTDEDLFKAIPPEGYSIRVGLAQSAANYNFKQQKDVISFLNKLCEADTITVQPANH